MIMRDQHGSEMETTLLVGVTFAFFGAGIVLMTACSRTAFAMSRDARFLAHRLLRRVNPRTHTPVPATILIFVLAVELMVALPGAALLKLIEASTILPAIIYGFTVVLHLAVRKRLDRKKGAFDLGRFELPVAIGALVWSVGALFALVSPPRLSSPSWSWSACSSWERCTSCAC
jgi:amino acid transporter